MYIKRLYDFLTRLAANNNRPWFNEHRAEYDDLRALWLDDLARLIALMAQWSPGIAALTPNRAAYRIYRDTRFSADKTPYKTYFSASVDNYGRNCERAGYYLHMGPGMYEGVAESGLYGGIWHPKSRDLTKVRRAIVDNPEEFGEILADPRLQSLYPGWEGRSLKRPPKGFTADDPFIDILKLQDIGRFAPRDMKYFDDPEWPVKVAEEFSVVAPLVNFINYSIEE